MLDYLVIYDLIYKKKTEQSYTQALTLLAYPLEGLEEAIRYMFLKDVYYRLKNKDKAMECGRLADECATKYFAEQEIIDDKILYIQCEFIKKELLKNGKCNVVISCFVSEEKEGFAVSLERQDYVIKDVTPKELKKLLQERYSGKKREEKYLYYEAIAKKISCQIRETISSELYNDLIISLNRRA